MKSDLDVARARAADLLEVARSHGARLKKDYGEWIGPCPACGGDDRFSISLKKGVWNCRGFGGGDVIALEMHLGRSTFGEAVLALTGRWQSRRREPTPEEAATRLAREKRRLQEAEAEAEAEAARNNRRAAEIVARLRPVAGTPGEAYLRDVRRIDVGHWAIRLALQTVETLGWSERTYFHQPDPGKPFHELHGQWLGAIVAILTDPVTAERSGGITRTFVHQGRKIGKAISLGGAGWPGIVRLSPDDEVLAGLNIAEGLETALSAMMMNFVPMWAMGSTGTMAAFPILAGIEALTIIADNDPNEAGIEAASTAYWRWKDAGREVHIRQSNELGDINDLIMRRAR
jgi:hypothetical protein